MNNPRVSIIILNWNGLVDTIKCLESLKGITYTNYEVIVVDNGSVGNDAQVLKEKFGDYIYLIQNEKNYGFAEGNNIGIRHVLGNTTPDYVLLLNNDTIVDPQFLNELVKVCEQDQSIGIAGPKIYIYGSNKKLQYTTAKTDLWRGRHINIGMGEIDTGQYNKVQETDYCDGSCFLIRRGAIQRIGVLDTGYFAYWEEIDYCLRARKGGFRVVWCPQAKIWHKSWTKIWEKSFASSRRALIIYYVTRNRFLLIKRHASKLQTVSFFLYYFAFQFWFLSGVYLVYHRSFSAFRSFLRGFGDGLQLLMMQR